MLTLSLEVLKHAAGIAETARDRIGAEASVTIVASGHGLTVFVDLPPGLTLDEETADWLRLSHALPGAEVRVRTRAAVAA